MIRTPHPPARDAAGRCWTLLSANMELDVEVTAADDARLAEVLPGLAELLGTPDVDLWAGSSLLDPGLSLAGGELAHGAVLGVGRPGPRAAEADRSSALQLHVVGGPDAGRTVALGQGDHVIGRGAEAHVVLTDPDVSRRHLQIHVGTGAITAADLGSTNGAFVDGERVPAEPRTWSTGTVLRLGSTGLTITGPNGYPLPTRPAPGGRWIVPAATRVTHPPNPVEIRLPRPPDPPARRRMTWLAIGVPTLGSILLAVLLHTPHLLFFALLAPAAALAAWASERWSGGRSSRRDAARYRVELRETGRQRAAAVHDDAQQREATNPNLATLTSAARRRDHLLWSRRGSDSDALTVRLGTGSGETSVVEIDPDGSRVPVNGTDVPVILDLRVAGGLGVVGPRPLGLGIVAAVLAQLTVLHAPGQVDLLLLVAEERLRDWTWARWLPHLRASAVRVGDARQPAEDNGVRALLEQVFRGRRPPARDDAPGGFPEQSGWLVVVVDRPLDARSAGLLRDAGSAGVIVLTLAGTVADLPVPVDALLTSSGETGERATLTRRAVSGGTGMVVDRLAPAVAARLARDLAPLRPAPSGSGLPQRVRLLDLPAEGPRAGEGEPTGSWSRDRDRLVARLGQGPGGPVEVDLCRLGPHALVAGTTGSGKSEFLQTMIAGLALNHPPDRCSFLLVDYKGGAAFAEAAALPHTVGVLTDLDGQTTERALRSLTAELVRREKMLADFRATDLAALPGDVALARLVIVVDEFATLAEEHPSFVPGLVGIAQRGRSLGVHLVLATQRPSGVVSAEIRANAALRVCLRTTDEADSRDVLGTPLAAHLPVDRPGRAYLRSGAGTPALFQVARVAGGGEPELDGGPQVRPWCWPRGPVPAERHIDRGESDLARISTVLRRRATHLGITEPHRPWRPPLPCPLGEEELGEATAALRTSRPPSGPTPPSRLVIGLVDKPAEQTWDLLELDLASDGAWLAVGAARSGRTTFLRRVLGEAVRQFAPAELHVHVLDQGGGAFAAEAAGLPHAGTTVSGDDALRSIRLLSRLADEVAVRRSTGRTTPRLLLLVDGVEPLMEQLDEFDPGSGSAAFLRLMRDGAAAGLTTLLTADRAVPGGRLASAVERRLVLPLADKADYAVAGVPPSAVPADRTAGRALLGEERLECQVAFPRPFGVLDADRSGPSGALRIPPLPERPVIVLPDRSAGVAEPAAPVRLPLGPGGDEGRPLAVDLTRAGGLLIAGPAASGRSTTLAALSVHLAWAGVPVAHLVPAHRRDPLSTGSMSLDPADEQGFQSWLAGLGGRPGALVADDVGLLADAPVLGRLPSPGCAGQVVLLAAATAAELARCYQGPVAALRRRRAGLVLCPGPGDGEPFGIRLPRIPLPRRPGSGWLVDGETVQRVQVARREPSSSGTAVTGPRP